MFVPSRAARATAATREDCSRLRGAGTGSVPPGVAAVELGPVGGASSVMVAGEARGAGLHPLEAAAAGAREVQGEPVEATRGGRPHFAAGGACSPQVRPTATPLGVGAPTGPAPVSGSLLGVAAAVQLPLGNFSFRVLFFRTRAQLQALPPATPERSCGDFRHFSGGNFV